MKNGSEKLGSLPKRGSGESRKIRITWEKIRHGKLTRIKAPSQQELDRLLDEGYTVAKTTKEGNNANIQTFSPLTYEQAREAEKLAMAQALGNLKEAVASKKSPAQRDEPEDNEDKTK